MHVLQVIITIEVYGSPCGRPVAIGLVLLSLYPVQWELDIMSRGQVYLKWIHVSTFCQGAF